MSLFFFYITPKFTLLLLPATTNSYSSISCCAFSSLIQLMHFLSSNFFFHIFPPLFSSLSAHIHIFLCLLSISPLTRPVSLDHAFHYSAASIDLLSGWSAIDYNTCSSATELWRYCCAKIVHINTRTWAHTVPLSSSPLLLLASISYPLQNIWQYTMSLLYLLLISIDTASRYSSAYWLVLHYLKTYVFMCNSSAIVLELIVRKRASWQDSTSRENSNSYWEFFPGKKASE